MQSATARARSAKPHRPCDATDHGCAARRMTYPSGGLMHENDPSMSENDPLDDPLMGDNDRLVRD